MSPEIFHLGWFIKAPNGGRGRPPHAPCASICPRAAPVFRARRNAFVYRILRSAYEKGRALGLMSGGWWLLPGGQAVGHSPARRSSRNFRHLPPTGRGRAWHLNPRPRALGSRGTSVTVRFNRFFYHIGMQHSHMGMPVLFLSPAVVVVVAAAAAVVAAAADVADTGARTRTWRGVWERGKWVARSKC